MSGKSLKRSSSARSPMVSGPNKRQKKEKVPEPKIVKQEKGNGKAKFDAENSDYEEDISSEDEPLISLKGKGRSMLRSKKANPKTKKSGKGAPPKAGKVPSLGKAGSKRGGRKEIYSDESDYDDASENDLDAEDMVGEDEDIEEGEEYVVQEDSASSADLEGEEQDADEEDDEEQDADEEDDEEEADEEEGENDDNEGDKKDSDEEGDDGEGDSDEDSEEN